MEWQPIETAPLDGTWVLGFSKTYNSQHVMQWREWNVRNKSHTFADDSFCEVDDPTHWMPLPAPPTN